MTTIQIQMRPYAGESDLPAIVELINRCESIDRLDEGTSLEELQQELTEPELDPARDIQLWEDSDGQLVGFGQLWIPTPGADPSGSLWFKVHPAARNCGIEAQIIAWGEERLREVARERGLPITYHSGAHERDSERRAVLEHNGFTIARYFLRMTRPLAESIEVPQLPAGFSLRPLAGEQEAEAWAELYNQSFIDHWNHHRATAEKVRHWISDPDYQPELNLVACAPDSTLAAFTWCSISPHENARSGRNEGWINLLGTRRGYRKRGLGRALLLAGLQLLKDAGADTGKLGVDAENPTGALRLYESVGFRRFYTRINYTKAM